MSQKIIIIGSTSGMGRRMAEIYAEGGNRVGATGRRKSLLDELQQQYPQQVETENFDITKNENIERLQSLVNKLGGLDLLIISAGIGESSKKLRWELDKLMVDTNVNGFVEIANWTYNFFERQGYGHLVTISSIAGIRGSSYAPAYSASKSFHSNYFEGLSIKARKHKKKIFITCIEPGFVNTKMAKGNKRFWVASTDKAARQIIKAIQKKKRKTYITTRWWFIAKFMKWAPYWLYRKFG